MHPGTDDLKQLRPRYLRFENFELDVVDETLRRDSENINVSHRMFQVLLLLVERAGDVVEKEEFFEKVWDGSFVEDNNLTVTITALRKVLGDDAKQARFIKNIPRKGYKFVADVTVASADLGDGPDVQSSQLTAPARPNESKAFWRRRAFKFSVAAASVLIFAMLALAVVRQRTSWWSTANASGRIDSIAVLPFEDLTGEREYLVDGLTDGVIGELSKDQTLRVIDRNSTYKYKGKSGDPAGIGRALEVRAIVTGTLQQDGDKFVITVDLLDLKSNTQVWRQQYRRSIAEIFETQRDISSTILQNLQLERSGPQQTRSSKRLTDDAEAYDLYLKGRYYWNKRTNADVIRSVEFFKAAIDRDPTFAQAYIGLGNAYTLGGFPGISSDERVQLSRGAIQRALEIDDSLGEAYSALAINKCYHDWDLAGAESHYRRAIELNPNDATAHHWYAELLAMQGRFSESLAEYDRALSLDPLSVPIRSDRALTYYYAHDFDTAIAELIKVRDLDPDYERTYEFLQWVFREKGMYKEATDMMESLEALQTRHGTLSAGDQHRVKKNVADLRKGLAGEGPPGFWRVQVEDRMGSYPYSAAVAFAKIGNADKAFEYLEKAYETHYTGMVWLKVTPEMDPLRSDSRFDDLIQRVGLNK